MNDFNRLTAVYADDLRQQREQVARRARHPVPHRRTTRRVIASGLHRIADHLDGE